MEFNNLNHLNKTKDNSNLLVMEKKKDEFEKIIPVLMQKGLENLNLSMFDSQTKTKVLIALGERYIRKGQIEDAYKAYLLAGNKEKLVEVGREYERIGLVDKAIECFRVAENKTNLERTGEKCFKQGKLRDAARAFLLIKDERWLKVLGEEEVKREKWDEAIKFLIH